jgi:hypothetical protein
MVDRPKDLIVAYMEYMCQPREIDDVNPYQMDFIPGDGVYTDAVINWGGDNPDYVVITEGNTIISRWYVIESTRTRGGQYQIRLFRDLFADYYEEIMDAPAFIEKGYVPTTDNAIFNAENMTFNQIKKDEFLLKDKTQSAWIVGYVARGEEGVSETITYGGIPDITFETPTLEDWEYYEAYNQEIHMIDNSTLVYSVSANIQNDSQKAKIEHVNFTFNSSGNISLSIANNTIPSSLRIKKDDVSLLKEYKATEDTDNIALKQINYKTYNYTSFDIQRLKDAIMKVGVGETAHYYRIKPNVIQRDTEMVIDSGTNLFINLSTLLSENVSGQATPIIGTPNDSSFVLNYSEEVCSIQLEAITLQTGFTTTLRQDRPILLDAPYCMFCIPYGDDYNVKFGNFTYNIQQINSFYLAMGIATSLGGLGENSKIYDLQLLPYCPIPLVREAGNTINLTINSELANNIIFDWNDETNTIIYWAKDSSGSFNIKYHQYIDRANPIQFKINALTKFQRLCSPNYNGVFEFSVEKNNGVGAINVDYTYKPYQPYIHLNPNFGRLYGKDFNDARGLILSGDFSLPVVLDSWENYQIQNKNYQAMFDRQIQNLETTNSIAREKEKWQMISNTVSGAVSGAGAGFMASGNPWGAVAGGVVGLGTSLGSGLADMHYNELLRQETIDYSRDQFGFQNQNIQALPDSLTKVSAYNINNKIFPFIERYTATPEEEKALENKLIYNGMTIGRIGTLIEYYLNKPQRLNEEYGYFKGQIIRLENIGDDSHVANAIAQEFNKGWYII